MHFVFWQNIISPHQAPFLRALPELGHKVTVVASESMSKDRLELGWKVPELGKSEVVINPDSETIPRLILGCGKGAIHVMAGARWTPLGNQAARHCRKTGCRIGVLTESPDPRGIRGLGRRLKYALERITVGSHYSFMLAMGEMGVKWFLRCGYPAERLFPFAYVTEEVRRLPSRDASNVISFLFAGRFVHLKGLDLLLRAFAAILPSQAQLRLLGDGPEKQNLLGLAASLGISEKVHWLPQTNNMGVMAEMERVDITLLPSRKDGWGAVVNESLMIGTPVICSSACGAAELIRDPRLGTVFKAGSVSELADALDSWTKLGPRSPTQRQFIRNWANCIKGSQVATYFSDIMHHVYLNTPRPVAPWRVTSLATSRP